MVPLLGQKIKIAAEGASYNPLSQRVKKSAVHHHRNQVK